MQIKRAYVIYIGKIGSRLLLINLSIKSLNFDILGGELYAKVSSKEKARLEEDEAKTYFAQIIDAIEHLVSFF